MSTDIFEQASRLKLTVPTIQGLISFMDLWDLPLQTEVKTKASLDNIAMNLDSKLGTAGRKSFVTSATMTDPRDQLTFDIVLHIIKVRQEENAQARIRAEKKANNARIMELIANKKDEALSSKSIEELEKLLKA